MSIRETNSKYGEEAGQTRRPLRTERKEIVLRPVGRAKPSLRLERSFLSNSTKCSLVEDVLVFNDRTFLERLKF